TLEGYRTGNQFRLGDELIVRVERVDLARRQLDFRLEKVTHHQQATPIGEMNRGGDRRSRDRKPSDRRSGGRSSGFKGQGGKGSGGPKRKKRR
ncbi:MAG: ribonuclease R, partial [Planctomycetota bacterium]